MAFVWGRKVRYGLLNGILQPVVIESVCNGLRDQRESLAACEDQNGGSTMPGQNHDHETGTLQMLTFLGFKKSYTALLVPNGNK